MADIAKTINDLERWIDWMDEDAPVVALDALALLKEQHKKGNWAMNSNFPDRLICSECSSQFDVWHWESKQMHFCPNCGSDMREDETN